MADITKNPYTKDGLSAHSFTVVILKKQVISRVHTAQDDKYVHVLTGI
jgi:hypothetical protein